MVSNTWRSIFIDAKRLCVVVYFSTALSDITWARPISALSSAELDSASAVFLRTTRRILRSALNVLRAPIMDTFPATPAAQVTLANWRNAPFNAWGFRNVRNIVPTAPIRCGAHTRQFPTTPVSLDSLVFDDRNGIRHRLSDVIATTYTDALIVLHGGRIVNERYLGGMQPDDQHILMSVSKSIIATLTGVLSAEGRLDVDALVTDYIPEAANCAYAGATVRHLLDMRVGIDFDEDYGAAEGVMIAYRESTGWNPRTSLSTPGDLRSFLLSLEKSGEHGGAFDYTSPNSDLLAWIIERAAGMPLSNYMSKVLWEPLGAEFDAYITVDSLGAPRGAGGICMTTRDLARVGQMMLENGLSEGRSVLPADWVHDTTTAGDGDAWLTGNFAHFFPDGQYRNKWYQYGNDLRAYCGLGIHGQFVYVAPQTSTVITRFGSHPDPLDKASEHLWIDAMDAIARHLG
jgi:CubicO group peptidase (beta-lactamase class C family)